MKPLILCVSLLWSTSAVADDFCDLWHEATLTQRLLTAQHSALSTWTTKNADLPLTAEGRERILWCVAEDFSIVNRDVTNFCSRGDEEMAFDRVLYLGVGCVQLNFITGGFEDRRGQ